MSRARFNEAPGPEASRLAFATIEEGMHHSDGGACEIARCVLAGIREAGLDPAQLLFCHEGPWHKVDRTWTR